MEYVDNLPPMDLMRSEKMTFVQLIIPVESANSAISYLGKLGLLQFRDVKRCGEMSRKLRFFKDQINKAGLTISGPPAMQPALNLEELEVQLADHENELNEMNSNSGKLQLTYNELLEFKMVLHKAGGFLALGESPVAPEERELEEKVYSNNVNDDNAFLLEQEMHGAPIQSGVRFVSGIISKPKALRFERMLFHVTRGNFFFQSCTSR